MCPSCEGGARSPTSTCSSCTTRTSRSPRAPIVVPGYTVDNFFAVWLFLESAILDPDKPIRKYTKKESSMTSSTTSRSR